MMTPTVSPNLDGAALDGRVVDAAAFTIASEGLMALLRDAAMAALDQTGWIAVKGEDRVRWLNGMTTNSIQALKAGEGCYNFLLSAQGRIQGDGYAFAGADELLIETGRAEVARLMDLLDRFIIMDDVELEDRSAAESETAFGLLCAGPQAAARMEAAGFAVEAMAPLEIVEARWREIKVWLVAAYGPLVPRYEIWTATEAQRATVMAALTEAGVVAVATDSVEVLRVLEGTPRYGVDIRERELPQETSQTRALHFAKGCYLGQEIVERIRSRGNVHRGFQAFELIGEHASAGALLSASVAADAATKDVGELTSVVTVPLDGRTVQLGLGYLRREVLERGAKIEYPGGVATVVSVPYTIPASE